MLSMVNALVGSAASSGLPDQNLLAVPACLRTPLAVCRDLIWSSTGNRLPLGLFHISWSPRP